MFRHDRQYSIAGLLYSLDMDKGSGWVGHVLLVRGGPERLSDICEDLERNGIETRGNPDVYIREYSQFGIDEARELRSLAYTRPVREKRRVFVVLSPRIMPEAQNALLKTLEEPPADALFFFVLPAPETLLPTVRSRAHLYEPRVARTQKNEETVDAAAFLAVEPSRRLDLLKPLLERDEHDQRDLGAIIQFLSSLERLAPPGKGTSAVYRARKYLTDKGALLKPLLEHVALLVPRPTK